MTTAGQTMAAPQDAAAAQPDAAGPGAHSAWNWSRFGPWTLVAIAVLWGLWELRPELRAVPYLDDSSIHQQMVRFAANRINQGHLPLTSWFPYLGLGSPQFLHYQSLPSMIAGVFGTVFDPNSVFRWSIYLLLALWPLVVYWSARVFGLGRWTAAAAAIVSPLLASSPGIGYEDMAYIWRGYGVWTQLWASWTLPLAWAFTYRALDARHSIRRSVLPAVFFIMVTAALHFETGYLAFVPLVVWPFLVPSDFWRRFVRAVLVGGAAFLASAWVIVPLLAQSNWAARNQILQRTGLENGYGARHFTWMLITGRIFDSIHWFPIITIFVGVGLVICAARWRTFLIGRALVSIFVVTLLMTFGRTTFGGLYSILPGSSDIFIRRFQMGVQFSGILIAGVGFVFVGRFLVETVTKWLPAARRRRLHTPVGQALVSGICVVGMVVVLAPAWTSMDTYNSGNADNVSLQAQGDAQLGPAINQLLDYVRAHPRGRVYAGQPTNWGSDFTVGGLNAVPVFKYLESQDIDEVGYTLRTASLMTDPEFYFNDANAGDYPLFGIGYVITPRVGTPVVPAQPAVPAERILCSGDYCLWALPDPGYIHVYDTTGVLDATRANVGSQSVDLLDSELLDEQRDLTTAFNGNAAATPTDEHPSASAGSPGHVVVERADLTQGRASAVVHLNRRATVVLSASYDPGWKVFVDGQEEPTVMVAPAVVGVVVGPGTHTVTFSYGGYGSYVPLFVLAVLVFVVLFIAPTAGRWYRRRRADTV